MDEMFIPSWGLQLDPDQVDATWVPNPLCAAQKAGSGKCWLERKKRWQHTQNRWVYGWDPRNKRWVATNGRDNARQFRTKRDLLRYAERMRTRWNWVPAAV